MVLNRAERLIYIYSVKKGFNELRPYEKVDSGFFVDITLNKRSSRLQLMEGKWSNRHHQEKSNS